MQATAAVEAHAVRPLPLDHVQQGAVVRPRPPPRRSSAGRAKYSTDAAFRDSYDWFLQNRHALSGSEASHHRSPAKQGILAIAKKVVR
ncbi:MAG: hypothetical protein WKF73_13035 [Nocardioidaceae bacterium]